MSWVREMRFGSKRYKAHLEDQAGFFKVEGICEDLDLVSPSAKLSTANLNNTLVFSVGYFGEIGKRKQENTAYLELLYKF